MECNVTSSPESANETVEYNHDDTTGNGPTETDAHLQNADADRRDDDQETTDMPSSAANVTDNSTVATLRPTGPLGHTRRTLKTPKQMQNAKL